MVTQHEVDYLAREVEDLRKRLTRVEGDNVALRADIIRLGALVVDNAERARAIEPWRGVVLDATAPHPRPDQ